MSWNFALILFLLLVLTGLIWLAEVMVLRKRRQRLAQLAAARVPQLGANNAQARARQRNEVFEKTNRSPWWIEYAISFFPVILFVFLLRSFVVEPFRIPSGSMLPTLQAGDFILVNKFSYGIRLPIIDKKIIAVGSPKRGDVLVFRYPVDPSVDYIKRVVGLPGDEIIYRDKQLYVNGTIVPRSPDGGYFEPSQNSYVVQYKEKLGDVEHKMLVEERRSKELLPIWRFPEIENCQYFFNGVRCFVPQGQYFTMGDNRDNSLDSRYWGFVPDGNIVGKAFFVWMNFSDLGRIGRFN
jgi:signal peptidase I